MTFLVASVACGYDLATANLMMCLSPRIPRPTLTALTFIAWGLSYALGTWSGGALAQWLGTTPYELMGFALTNYHVLFLCGLLVRLVNAAFIAPLLREPTSTATIDTFKDIVPDFALSFSARLVRSFRVQGND
jgi:MFS family permease